MTRFLVLTLLAGSAHALSLRRSATSSPLSSDAVSTRRRVLADGGGAAAAAAATLCGAASPARASGRSRSVGYTDVRLEREWMETLTPQQYFILRSGGTERQNSSPLVGEKRAGAFRCAGCRTKLFDAADKFESGTGWPSFGFADEATVEVEAVNPAAALLLGAEVRCGTCGGHLGDLFLDGKLFQGTPAARSGKRYCIDGAALVFEPADGAPLVIGEERRAPGTSPQGELPSWLQPPGVKVL